jgi:uncharacterized NAD(P)/FAD-binding protein YdhS
LHGKQSSHSPGSSRAISQRELTPRTVAIVGAGFSGTLVAIHMLRSAHERPVRIVLIDRDTIARGVAYARRPYRYLLNVPAARMSANSADPAEFLAFAQRTLPNADANDFLPRELYGEYLKGLLTGAELYSQPRVHLACVRGSVVALERPHDSSEIYLRFADGRRLIADTVVLALGNPPPARIEASEAVRGSSRYVENPWAEPQSFNAGERILVAGTGLTMADIVLAGNQSAGGKAVIHAISRHGLTPLPQTTFRVKGEFDAGSLVKQVPCTARQLLRATRALAKEAEGRGGDWREAVAQVRTLTPALWQCLPSAERRRFLRHVRVYWDVHRHRLPPSVWNLIDELRRNGTLHVHAGHLLGMQLAGKRIRVTWRVRGEDASTTLLADRVINCTGPHYDVHNSRDPLLRSLVLRGIAVPDPLGLGLLTDEFGALKGLHGARTHGLYYIGPMLRADHWETTSVQELRQHAEYLAHHLCVLLNQ